jgi:hypothetical protein
MRGAMIKARGLPPAFIPILMVSLGTFAPASAEPIACFPDQKGCGELVVEKKVHRSFERAVYVFVGQLESVQDSRSGIKSTRIFTFKIEKPYKGALAGNVARLSMDSYVTGGNPIGATRTANLHEFEQLEAAAEVADTEEAKKQYYRRLASLRENIKQNDAAETAPTHVVRLDISDGDRFLRRTDIPMRVGERYAVFVYSKAALAPDPEEESGNWSTWIIDPADLYPMNGERGKRALAALEQASKPMSQ